MISECAKGKAPVTKGKRKRRWACDVLVVKPPGLLDRAQAGPHAGQETKQFPNWTYPPPPTYGYIHVHVYKYIDIYMYKYITRCYVVL